MKKIVSLLVVFATLIVNAENYTIKMLNTNTININGKELTVGDSFNEFAKIKWSSDNQAMKVLSESNELIVVANKLFKKLGVKDFSDFISSNKAATVRSSNELPVTIEDYMDIFNGNFVLIDKIHIPISWKVDSLSFFTAEAKINGDIISKKIPHVKNELVIMPEFVRSFTENDSVQFTIRYVEKGYNDSTLITSGMNIYIAPNEIEY